jgi:hypothetical protein
MSTRPPSPRQPTRCSTAVLQRRHFIRQFVISVNTLQFCFTFGLQMNQGIGPEPATPTGSRSELKMDFIKGSA